MSAAFSRSRVPDITSRQWAKARELFENKGERIEPGQLHSATGMGIDAAHSLIMGIFQEKIADLYWLVFHDCDESGGSNVDTRKYEDGFQPVPYVCPACEAEITDPDDLMYELRAILRSAVEFVE